MPARSSDRANKTGDLDAPAPDYAARGTRRYPSPVALPRLEKKTQSILRLNDRKRRRRRIPGHYRNQKHPRLGDNKNRRRRIPGRPPQAPSAPQRLLWRTGVEGFGPSKLKKENYSKCPSKLKKVSVRRSVFECATGAYEVYSFQGWRHLANVGISQMRDFANPQKWHEHAGGRRITRRDNAKQETRRTA